jgi:hypothetical protein
MLLLDTADSGVAGALRIVPLVIWAAELNPWPWSWEVAGAVLCSFQLFRSLSYLSR